MKQLFKLISINLRSWYYFQELKEISLAVAGILAVWAAYVYGTSVLHFLFTKTGLISLTFLMASIVLGMVIKIYYRIMVIKYYEKDINIGLYKEVKIKS